MSMSVFFSLRCRHSPNRVVHGLQMTNCVDLSLSLRTYRTQSKGPERIRIYRTQSKGPERIRIYRIQSKGPESIFQLDKYLSDPIQIPWWVLTFSCITVIQENSHLIDYLALWSWELDPQTHTCQGRARPLAPAPAAWIVFPYVQSLVKSFILFLYFVYFNNIFLTYMKQHIVYFPNSRNCPVMWDFPLPLLWLRQMSPEGPSLQTWTPVCDIIGRDEMGSGKWSESWSRALKGTVRPVLLTVSIAVRRHHDPSNSYTGKPYLLGSCLQRLTPLSSRQEAWWHAGKHSAAGSESSTSIGISRHKEESDTGPCLDIWNPKGHHQWSLSSNKFTLTPKKPLLPMPLTKPSIIWINEGRSYSNHHS
jgi:hypothetical protein